VKKGQRHNWQGARNVMSVWDIQNLSSKSVREREGVSGHGTQKPIECMARPIMNNSAINDLVYDPFIGSGTTMVAAHQLHRNCYAMEITPKHCQMVIERMKRFDSKIIVTINGLEYNGNI
jgi:DNA modification methylase